MKKFAFLFIASSVLTVFVFALGICNNKKNNSEIKKVYYIASDGHYFETKEQRTVWDTAIVQHRRMINQCKVKGIDTSVVGGLYDGIDTNKFFSHPIK